MPGFCRWWFIEVDKITYWPGINPQTQKMRGEPSIAEGATWYGPVKVVPNQLGWQETETPDKRGIYYKQLIEGVYPGDNPLARISLENMAYYKYIVVGKQFAGNMFVVIGTPDSPLDFVNVYNTGKGNSDTAGNKFQFTGETLAKGLIIDYFSRDHEQPPVQFTRVLVPFWYGWVTISSQVDTEAEIEALQFGKQSNSGETFIADYSSNPDLKLLCMAELTSEPVKKTYFCDNTHNGLVSDFFNIVTVGKYRLYISKGSSRLLVYKTQFRP